MAYRRKHGPQRSLTFIEDCRSSSSSSSPFAAADDSPSPLISSLPSLHHSAHAIHASTYGDASAVAAAAQHRNPKHLTRSATYATPKDSVSYEYTSMRSLNEAKYGFWGVLARKAKSILEDDNTSPTSEEQGRSRLQKFDTSSGGQEGLTMVENRTADIIQETRKSQIRRKSGSFSVRNQPASLSASSHLYPNLNDHETQLKALRDVANAMAAKAKLLLRELNTIKADLAFAKERCAQLEEENKLLRESRDNGGSIEDDDLIRLQLETLLEEKGRLAHKNSIYARENRFLREIVEYHQLTMQDVVYVNEGIEEVAEVCPIQLPPRLSNSNSPGRLSPIISTPGSSDNSANTTPRYPNSGDAPEIFLTAGSASPTTPSPRV